MLKVLCNVGAVIEHAVQTAHNSEDTGEVWQIGILESRNSSQFQTSGIMEV